VYTLDLKTRKATKLPGSDGRIASVVAGRTEYCSHYAGFAETEAFDLATQKWTEVANIFVAYPAWSRDGRYLYFNGDRTTQRATTACKFRITNWRGYSA
jgi:hypothetical protein